MLKNVSLTVAFLACFTFLASVYFTPAEHPHLTAYKRYGKGLKDAGLLDKIAWIQPLVIEGRAYAIDLRTGEPYMVK